MPERRIRLDWFPYINGFLMALLIVVMLYPFVYVLSLSLSAPEFVMRGQITLWPKGLNMESYSLIVKEPAFLQSYWNTIRYSVTATIICLAVTLITAYPLSKASFRGTKWLMKFYVITLFFSGGLIPNYLLVQNLGLIDSMWSLVFPVALNVWHIIICRAFLQSIPESLSESAHMDGANDWVILIRIMMPLSMPILATLTLFTIVEQWNSFFLPMLYLNSPEMQPLSLFLRRILLSLEFLQGDAIASMESAITPESFKGAAIIVSILPIVSIYPFIQKYFIKGMLIGSVKG